MVTQPSGKARVCKTLIPRFKSGCHLHIVKKVQMPQAVSLRRQPFPGFLPPSNAEFEQQMAQAFPVDQQRFEPLCCRHFAGLYAGALFESVFFKKGAVFQTKKIHKNMGTVLLVLITNRVVPFLFSQNSKRAPARAGQRNKFNSIEFTRSIVAQIICNQYTRR